MMSNDFVLNKRPFSWEEYKKNSDYIKHNDHYYNCKFKVVDKYGNRVWDIKELKNVFGISLNKLRYDIETILGSIDYTCCIYEPTLFFVS
jgi:hypothetical protein